MKTERYTEADLKRSVRFAKSAVFLYTEPAETEENPSPGDISPEKAQGAAWRGQTIYREGTKW